MKEKDAWYFHLEVNSNNSLKKNELGKVFEVNPKIKTPISMRNLVYTIVILLVAGCQQGSSTSSFESDSKNQEKKIETANEEIKDKEELFYENMIGKDFAMLSFTTIDNEDLSTSFLRDKVVFLNFWYKNCPPCIAEMEGLNQLYEKYSSENSVFIMITFEGLKVIQEIQKEYVLPYKMVTVDKEKISNWGIRGYPSSFVLDKSGRIVYARAGGQVDVQKATEEVLTKFGPQIETQLTASN